METSEERKAARLWFWVSRGILAVGTSFTLLFLWWAATTQDSEGQLVSAALGSAGVVFFAPIWGALRGKIPRWFVLLILLLILLGAMEFDAWAWHRAQGPIRIHFYDFWGLLVFAIPGMFWLLWPEKQTAHPTNR